MRPITINFPAITTNSIVTASATAIPAGTPFVLNGGALSNIFTGQTTYYYDLPAGVSIAPMLVNNSANNYTGATFTFIGTSVYGEPLNITRTGPAANASNIVGGYFNKITSITCNQNITNLSIGLSGNGAIDIQTDTWNLEAQYTLQYSEIESPGTTEYTVVYSAVNPTSFDNGIYQYNPLFENTLFEIPLTNTANVFLAPEANNTFPLTSATSISIHGIPVSAFATFITYPNPSAAAVGEGSLKLTFLQQGARY